MENEDVEQGSKNHVFFVEDLNSSEGEEDIMFSHQKLPSSCKRAARLSREGSPPSPPLLLAFNITSGRPPHLSSPSPPSSLEEEDSDQPIEEWMLLGGEEQVGDSSIQLNLSYRGGWEDDSGDEDQTVKSVKDTWAVSEKDKGGADRSLPSRYFSRICNICNKTGHLAKSCYSHKKSPTCVLCGIQGHVQRDCPGRPCPNCALPSHGLRPCERPRVWNQHCHRCGMMGHLSDTCPDTWRQYHFTIRSELPVRPWTAHVLKKKKCPAHCCNCSERGHYGYECTKRRMISGTFYSLPYVCHYDTIEDVLQCHPKKQKRDKDQQHLPEATSESGEENRTVQGWSRRKQETCKKKRWPKRCKERREVKRLRKDAQTRQVGRQKSWRYYVEEVCPPALEVHKQYTPPPKKRKDGAGGKSRKSRESERWKKRGGLKRGNLYPHNESLRPPPKKARHRQR
ncbi:zinc finger CCHC domain-containing protein 7-like isoform X2 [Pseudoliparis swirei]|uniref:zinc finger CCHC domain-containing protein 7-like isoform X2 n=1 Tax=Pseudoliparis swirei TaxID=2059687 RepID=UPI0024BEFD23|nr:zinc finger CCHC domain-containing protein 7-like isoform X2 [Pseudoliparis swirei]